MKPRGGDRRSKAAGGPGGVRDRVLVFLREQPKRAFLVDQVAAALSVHKHNAYHGLASLVKMGLAERVRPGVYRAGGTK